MKFKRIRKISKYYKEIMNILLNNQIIKLFLTINILDIIINNFKITNYKKKKTNVQVYIYI